MGGLSGMMDTISPYINTGMAVSSTLQRNSSTQAATNLAQQQFDYQKQQDVQKAQQDADTLAYQRQQQADALAYQKQQDELNRQAQEAARAQAAAEEATRLQATKDAETLKYQQEQAAREQQAKLDEEAQRRQWEYEEKVRQESTAKAAAEAEAARQEAAAQRQQAMEIFTGAQNNTYQQLLNRQNQEWTAAEGNATTQIDKIDQDATVTEQARQTALRQTQAKTRARLGAQGVNAADGSGAAILTGQAAQTAADTAAAAKSDQLRKQAIQADLDNRRRVNLLEQAALADQQRMDFINRFYG